MNRPTDIPLVGCNGEMPMLRAVFDKNLGKPAPPQCRRPLWNPSYGGPLQYLTPNNLHTYKGGDLSRISNAKTLSVDYMKTNIEEVNKISQLRVERNKLL